MLAGARERKAGEPEMGRILARLSAYHPDNGCSCLMDNEIVSHDYDIQVIMPVYNTAATVCAAVESVLTQTGGERILLTVINDGSPDGARELLRQYEGHPDVEIIDQDNRGLSGARNAGLRRMRAKYVTFLDSDDRLAEGGLHRMMEAARRYDADIVQGGFCSVRPDGRLKGRWIPPELSESGWMLGFPWGKLYRSGLFASVGFPERYWYEDTLMSMIIFPLARVKVSVSAPVYYYMLNPVGITFKAKSSRKVLDSLWVTMRLFADRESLGLKPSAADYESFLLQVRNNHRRVFRQAGNEMAAGIFAVHRQLRERYFHGESFRQGLNESQRRMDRALATDSYSAFRLLVGLK